MLAERHLSHLTIFGASRVMERRTYASSDMIAALRNAAEERAEDQQGVPLSVGQYKQFRKNRLAIKPKKGLSPIGKVPSSSSILARYGSWRAACEAALRES